MSIIKCLSDLLLRLVLERYLILVLKITAAKYFTIAKVLLSVRTFFVC